MKAYFVSDFHLKFKENEEDTSRRKRVISFLEDIVDEADLLVMNGDIFDLWFAWDQVIIKGYFPLLKALSDLKDSGCRLVLVAGNHDFWFNGFLTEYLNMEIYPDHFQEKIDNKLIYVTHGDLHTSNDLRYKLFRTLIRNKLVKSLFKMIHPDIALNLGILLSRSSRERKMSPSLKKAKENGLDKFATKMLQKNDLIVMGHSHSPKMDVKENGIYVNLGDWVVNNTYLEMIDGEINLKKYTKKEKE